MSYPATYKMKLRQGATFRRVFTWAIDGEPINLSGWSVRSQIRKTAASETVVLDLGDYIELDTEGIIDINIPDSVTEDIPAGKYVYDIELDSGGETTTLLAGPVEVAAEVTRG